MCSLSGGEPSSLIITNETVTWLLKRINEFFHHCRRHHHHFYGQLIINHVDHCSHHCNQTICNSHRHSFWQWAANKPSFLSKKFYPTLSIISRRNMNIERLRGAKVLRKTTKTVKETDLPPFDIQFSWRQPVRWYIWFVDKLWWPTTF